MGWSDVGFNLLSAKIVHDSAGGFVATFRDVPEAITQGDDLDEALLNAADALEEAVAGRIRRGDVIAAPTRPRRRERLVALPAAMAAKAALYVAMKDAKLTNVALARRLGCDEK